MPEERKGLCYRCEHRARFFETGRGPRYECQQPEMAVHGCYMYKPVKPLILKKQKGDKRPEFAGAMLSARQEYVGLPDFELNLAKVKDGKVLYWEPPPKKAD